MVKNLKCKQYIIIFLSVLFLSLTFNCSPKNSKKSYQSMDPELLGKWKSKCESNDRIATISYYTFSEGSLQIEYRGMLDGCEAYSNVLIRYMFDVEIQKGMSVIEVDHNNDGDFRDTNEVIKVKNIKYTLQSTDIVPMQHKGMSLAYMFHFMKNSQPMHFRMNQTMSIMEAKGRVLIDVPGRPEMTEYQPKGTEYFNVYYTDHNDYLKNGSDKLYLTDFRDKKGNMMAMRDRTIRSDFPFTRVSEKP